MADNSKIEWTDHTFNPWEGCTKISAACDNCYAADRAARFKTVEWGGPRRHTSKSLWNKPLRWQKDHASFFAEHGRKQRVFCASLADVFDNQVDPEWRAELWDLIRKCPDLNWQLLTKRPQNISKMKPEFWDEIKGRIWLGVTIENQKTFDTNWQHITQQDSAVIFFSMEPLLDHVDITPALRGLLYRQNGSARLVRKIDWVVAGGESGPNARPSNPQWFYSLQHSCEVYSTPFLFKQWGEWGYFGDLYSGRKSDKDFYFDSGGEVNPKSHMRKVGKSLSGRVLWGKVYHQFPKG